ncbi:hypothetical protein PHYSODRAFT_343400 [Phytophthora sojae]|uniref:Uncharacterized protein n=1 Tax=Phytophthora sojae (strain P6497) TaxID=1094619 RepID=G5AJJ3_PHYSP|nr:hypothetical protein PHYSODRAFT_343400 [Phytophthora sojae]EGZ04307.1 hypothetical protein PHYSODRAFT_343400 [Phytophthora sojae]|eukprot:XP_009540244.1 hypothetical protein PHYSODRAFT_343400 [Phytophthora sojae]
MESFTTRATHVARADCLHLSDPEWEALQRLSTVIATQGFILMEQRDVAATTAAPSGTTLWRSAELFSEKGGRADRLEAWEIGDRETGSKDLRIRRSSSGDLRWSDDAGA